MGETTTSAVSRRLCPFGTTIFAAMTALARANGAVNLSQGFPDENGPAILIEAAARAVREYDNQYAPLPGLPELRGAIAGWWAGAGNREPDPDSEVTVTSGCTEAIAATLLGLLNPGDEVVLFEPFYDSYHACIAMAGAVPRFVPLRRRGARFAFDPDELRSAFTSRTRAVLLNTPHNPTGKVFEEHELRTIADLCIEHGAVAITDEVYERLVFSEDAGRPHVSMASLDGMSDRTITLSSLGKTLSMTGWKIGWAIAPSHLTGAVRAAHQFLVFAVPTPLQHAAAEALRHPGTVGWVGELARSLRVRRDRLLVTLADLGFAPVTPDAGYFIMADHTAVSRRLSLAGDIEFVRAMTTQAGVAAIPPSAFCVDKDLGRDWVRFAFCKNETLLAEAGARLRAWLA